MTKKVFLNFCALPALLLLSINAAHSQEALVVHSRDGAPSVSAIVLDNIQRITFSGGDMSVKPFGGSVDIYILDDIAKITFGDAGVYTDVTTPLASDLAVVVYVAPAGEIVVESPEAIQSLTLFNVDGKILRSVAVAAAQTTLNASTLPTGIYLLQIKTQQGVVTKKIIKK